MGTRERDEQAEQERAQQQEQERNQQQPGAPAPRGFLNTGEDETTTQPVIINH